MNLSITSVSVRKASRIALAAMLVLTLVVGFNGTQVLQAHAENVKMPICHNGNVISPDSNGWNGHQNHDDDFFIENDDDLERCASLGEDDDDNDEEEDDDDNEGDNVSCTLVANPNPITVGGNTTLTLNILGEDADEMSAVVDNGVGALSDDETEVVSPLTTTIYTATLSEDDEDDEDWEDDEDESDEDTVTCSVTVTVNPAPPQEDSCVVVSDVQTLEGGLPAVLVSPIHEAWTAAIAGASWIWGENPISDAVNPLSETFTRTFSVVGVPTGATLNIAADNSYSVKVNGVPVGADATESNYSLAGQDTITIAAVNLVAGTNTIEFTVNNFAQSGGTMSSNPAGLLYKLTVNETEGGGGAPPPVTCELGTELLKNGGFENPEVASGWDAYPTGTALLEWVADFLDAGAPAVGNVEIQESGLNGWLSTGAGNQWTELDADWGGPASSQSGEAGSVELSQTIATVAGATYTVSFDFSARPQTDQMQNQMQVYVDGVLKYTVPPIATLGNQTAWVNHSFTFVALDGSAVIAFRDSGTPNDSLGSLMDNASAKCTAPKPTNTATVHAQKVMCDAEIDLPNWGDGDNVTIGATTAADYVAASNGRCELVDWTFQWAPVETANPGDNLASALAPWTTFASFAVLPDANDATYWFREVIPSGYIPFSTDVEAPYNDVSAEFYCGTDVLNYDNYDFVSGVDAGEHLYCVGFNVPMTPPQLPQCSDGVDNVDGEDTLVDAQDPGCMSGEGGSYNPDDNDEYNRVVEEEPTTGTLRIVKYTEGADGYFTFKVKDSEGESMFEDPEALSISTNSHEGDRMVDLLEGTYTVTEDIESGWDLTSVSCTYDGESEGVSILNGHQIYIDGGETVTCTFYNTYVNDDEHDTTHRSSGGSGSVLGASAETCSPLLTDYMRIDWKNEEDQVKKLQEFLNEHLGSGVEVNGIFGQSTYNAVKVFQQKYWEGVLKPWVGLPASGISGAETPTGFVYQTTRWQINNIWCPGSEDFPETLN